MSYRAYFSTFIGMPLDPPIALSLSNDYHQRLKDLGLQIVGDWEGEPADHWALIGVPYGETTEEEIWMGTTHPVVKIDAGEIARVAKLIDQFYWLESPVSYYRVARIL